jgi:hypothetical protein
MFEILSNMPNYALKLQKNITRKMPLFCIGIPQYSFSLIKSYAILAYIVEEIHQLQRDMKFDKKCNRFIELSICVNRPLPYFSTWRTLKVLIVKRKKNMCRLF